MKKKYLVLFVALFAFSIPLFSIVSGHTLTNILKDLYSELKTFYLERADKQRSFSEDYERQHQRMIDVIANSNELSLLLYTQDQDMTFDLTYALKKVTGAYNDFHKDRRPYDHIVNSLNIEIDRYGRLINALRRLPPTMKQKEVEMEIEVREMVPDSLLIQSDSLGSQVLNGYSSLEKEIIRIAYKDTLIAYKDTLVPFILDAEGESYRDSCIQYASELRKLYLVNRDTVMADSMHYQEAYWRMQETYEYAQTRYKELERYIFEEGQTPFKEIMADPGYFWNKVVLDLREQYDFMDFVRDSARLSGVKSMDTLLADSISVNLELVSDSAQLLATIGADTLINDSIGVNTQVADTAVVNMEIPSDSDIMTYVKTLSSKGYNAFLVIVGAIQIIALIFFWILTFLILLLVCSIFKKKAFVQRYIPRNKLSIFSILVGTILYFLLGGVVAFDEYTNLSIRHVNTLLGLLIAISSSLLLRVKPEQIRNSFRLYVPTFFIAMIIILCRITFVPDRFMVLLFPPILALTVLRQLFSCIRENGKATTIDITLGWISLVIFITAFVFSFLGYTFVALLILVWWYFQMTVLLAIACVSDLLARFKEKWLNDRVNEMRERITYVAGSDRETLLLGATWYYDLVKQVAIPAMMLLSLPMCIHLSLNVFDFNELFVEMYCNPFVQIADDDGSAALTISFRSIINLSILFFAIRYINRAIHAIWQFVRYKTFMRKHKRDSIRANEINLSLGNSIISVVVWMTYIIVVVVVWQMPVSSLSLVAGGLSAGIGFALKDVLNNFIYGIQLMGGRLRVGDWIECDGVRGRVVAINYQCVQVETIDGTEMSFLNSSLFGKNFNNLTRNNSYEFTKIIVGVAYGSDIKQVREVIVEAMQQMRTKDSYGREIVDPKKGVYVVVDNMSDSAVDIAVKQYVLVAERIGYVDRAKEVIYDALNAAGIVIAFPQCDVHFYKE